MALTTSQQRALALLPKISGGASVVSSILIASLILRDGKKRSKVYHRLVLGMSFANISSSIWLAMSTWPIPEETGILWAVGNTVSCNFQGFFIQFGISSPVYDVSLSMYFLLAVRYGWKEDQLKRVDPFFHLLPFLWASGTAFAGLFLQLFNSASLWCWIASYPGRNEDADFYRWVFFYAPLWLSILIVTINLLLVFQYVRRITMRSETYSFSFPSAHIDEQGSSTNRYPRQQQQRQQAEAERKGKEPTETGGVTTDNNTRRSLTMSFRETAQNAIRKVFILSTRSSRSLFARKRKQVALQCLRYALAFYWTWIPITIVRIFETIGHPNTAYGLILLAAMNTPMQGLPNFAVYLYPLVVQAKKQNSTRGLWNWIKISLTPSNERGRTTKCIMDELGARMENSNENDHVLETNGGAAGANGDADEEEGDEEEEDDDDDDDDDAHI